MSSCSDPATMTDGSNGPQVAVALRQRAIGGSSGAAPNRRFYRPSSSAWRGTVIPVFQPDDSLEKEEREHWLIPKVDSTFGSEALVTLAINAYV